MPLVWQNISEICSNLMNTLPSQPLISFELVSFDTNKKGSPQKQNVLSYHKQDIFSPHGPLSKECDPAYSCFRFNQGTNPATKHKIPRNMRLKRQK